MGVVGFVASCDPTRRSRAHPAIGPTTPRSRRGTRGPQARDQPPRPRRLDCPRPDDQPQLDGAGTSQIAAELHCHPQTVHERIKRFNAEGLDGLGDRPGAGRKPRLTEHKRSQLIALVKQLPPGRLRRQADGSLHADQPDTAPHWTLDALAQAAPPRRSASRCSAARSAAACWPRESAGAGRAPGPSPATRSSPQKDRDRRALHPPAGPCEVTDGRAVVAGHAIRVPRRTDKSGTERTITVNSATLMSGPPLTPRAPP
jgi:transposase